MTFLNISIHLREPLSVSTLVILAGLEDEDGDHPNFETVLLAQVKTLKAQLGKDSGEHDVHSIDSESPFHANPLPPPPMRTYS